MDIITQVSNWRSRKTNPCPVCGDTDGSCKGKDNLIICYDGLDHRNAPPPGYRFVKEADGSMGGIFAPLKEQRPQPTQNTEYVYHTADEQPYHRVTRYYQGGKKKFAQAHWDGYQWKKGLPKGFQRIPYRLPEIVDAKRIAIVEGEKDCETARASGIEAELDLVFITNPEGAKKWPKGWGKEYLRGKQVVILPDNDADGVAHARQVWADVAPWVESVALVMLPGLKPKGDLTDYLDAGGTVKSVERLLVNAFLAPHEHGLELLPDSAEAKAAPEPSEKATDGADDDDDDANANPEPALAIRYRAVKAVIGKQLRFNSLTKQLELQDEPLEDLDYLRLRLALDHKISVPQKDITTIAMAIGKEHAYSPVVDYLDRVSQAHGSDTSILDDLASRYLGSDHPLHQIYLKRTLIAAVARAYQPGEMVQHVLILQSKQGRKKSAFFRTLASPDWFDDTMGSSSDKDERLKLHKVWFCEWAELEAVFKRREVSQVKAFITTNRDLVRAPYERNHVFMPRPSIIVGSTNETEFLADSTGNRRFWVIPVTRSKIDSATLRAERDRIWAAAVSAYRAGEIWHLTDEQEVESAELVSEFEISDPWQSDIEPHLRDLSPQQVTIDMIFRWLDIEPKEQDQRKKMRITRILKALGFEVKVIKAEGRRSLRVWER